MSKRKNNRNRKQSVRTGNRSNPLIWALTVLATLLAIGTIVVMGNHAEAAKNEPRYESLAERVVFNDLEAQMREFIQFYEDDIPLTPEQAAIKVEVLDSMPAPCCSNTAALTCCCPCNLSKSTWGLTHYLLSTKGYDANQLRGAITEWLAFTNPNGFSGDACYTPGGCERPSHQNGCSGMKEVVI